MNEHRLQLTKYSNINHNVHICSFQYREERKRFGTKLKYQHHSPITTPETQTFSNTSARTVGYLLLYTKIKDHRINIHSHLIIHNLTLHIK